MTQLAEVWRGIAKILGLEVETPFRLILPHGSELEVDALLKNFGAEKGMLLVDDYEKIRKHESAITDAGYGYSVLYRYPENYEFNREATVKMLADWGWAGPAADMPIWLNDVNIEDDE